MSAVSRLAQVGNQEVATLSAPMMRLYCLGLMIRTLDMPVLASYTSRWRCEAAPRGVVWRSEYVRPDKVHNVFDLAFSLRPFLT